MTEYKTDLLDLRRMDCMDLMRDLPDKHFALAIVDPPYGIGCDGYENNHVAHPSKRCAGKYHFRSLGVLTDCDMCLFIHDGKSKGTKNEITVCKKLNKPFEYVVLNEQ